MSLATTCPQCKTSFKVVPDQLKLRRGLVRCGVCRHVFSGVDHLRYVEDPPPPARAQRQPPGDADRSRAAAAAAASPATIVPAQLLAQVPFAAQPRPRADAPTTEQAAEHGASGPWEDTGAGAYALAGEDTLEGEPAVEGERAGTSEQTPAGEDRLEGEPALEGEEPAIGGERTGESEEALASARAVAAGGAFASEQTVAGEHAGQTVTGEDAGPTVAGEDAVTGEETVTGDDAADQGAGDTITRWGEYTGSRIETPHADAQAPTATGPGAGPEAQREHEALVRLRMRSQTSPFRDTLPQLDDAQPDQGTAREWLESARSGLANAPAEEDAVDFFASHRRARGFSARSSVFAAVIAAVLALALVVQLAVGARDWLAARAPAMRPLLAAVLAPAGLAIRAPRALDALTIESFELQSAGGEGMLSMSALLRNAAGHAVRWPAMELSLSDGSGSIAVRKVLMPEDYLGAAARERDAIGPNAEWPVRVALQADGVEATAYSVKLFYP